MLDLIDIIELIKRTVSAHYVPLCIFFLILSPTQLGAYMKCLCSIQILY